MILASAAALLLTSSPAIGAPAPSFSATDMTGVQRKLSDFAGKWVVLEWTNRGCPFVKKHYESGNMQATQAWAKDQGVVWISIVSSAEGKQGFVNASDAKSYYKDETWKGNHLILDPDGKIGRAYEAKTTPQMFVIAPDQKVVYMGAIDSDSTANPEAIKTATNYVKKALTEVMAGKPVETPVTKPYGCSVKYGN